MDEKKHINTLLQTHHIAMRRAIYIVQVRLARKHLEAPECQSLVVSFRARDLVAPCTKREIPWLFFPSAVPECRCEIPVS